MAISDYLNNLITQRDNLADNLVTKGVSASKTELLDTLVPKVLQIEGSSGSNGLNIFTQMNEPKVKEGIWLKTTDTYVDIVTDSNVWTAGSWADRGADIPYDFYLGSAVSIGTDIYLLGSSATGNQKNCYKYSGGVYTKMADIPYIFYSSQPIVNMNNYIYLFGTGDHTTSGARKYCYRYNISDNAYTRLADIPYGFTGGSVVIVGSYIYLLGNDVTVGYSGLTNYRYDIITNTYTKMADVPYSFYRGSAVSIGTDIYLLGSSATGNQKNCYKYDTLTNTYTKMADVPYSFHNGSAVAIGTDIYLLGSSATGNQKNCYKYDTLTNTYTKMADIPYSFYRGSAVFVQSRIHTLGGIDYPTYNQIYSLTAKQFSNNSFVIERVSNYYGKYFTQFHETPSNFNPVNFGRITSGFDNAWIYNNDDLQEYPAYYGNGTSWIKFKN